MAFSDFDLDLKAGQLGEQAVANVLSIDTVEVKTDFKWRQTGNLYIETECWYNSTSSWGPSGLEVTKATHWAFNLAGIVLIVEVETLKKICARYGRPITCDIEPNPTKGILITPEHILQYKKF